MKYQEFLDYIYQRHSGNVKLGLDRMLNILTAMDNPNQKLQGIHIAGTNGKGSTAAMCEAMSLANGLSTGLNTSPHLVDYRERIRVNGNNISLNYLIDLYKQWEPIFEENEASFFEITTAMAFSTFMNEKVENAIFEVGLGGRLDGTNPFQSTVSIITSISFDHTKSLGDTIEKIAYEKAGILKPHTPVVLGKLPDSALKVISDIAEAKQCPLIINGKDFTVNNVRINSKGTVIDYRWKDHNFNDLEINLLGSHQAQNAAVAITAFILFMERTGRKFSESTIRKGLSSVKWPGRLQIIASNPMTIIDGAHNEEGITSLRYNLEQLFPNKNIFFVLAILRDKNLEKIIANICAVSHKIFISKNHSTRAAEIEDQEAIVKQHGTEYEIIPDIVDATQKARSIANKDDVVIISGSLYTISEILKAKEKFIE